MVQTHSPCRSPRRNLARVMRAKVWELSWARRGVRAVITAHRPVEMNRTRSPPTLKSQHSHSSVIKLQTHLRSQIIIIIIIIISNCEPFGLMHALLTCHWHVPPGSVWNSSPSRIHPGPVPSRSCSIWKRWPWWRHRSAWPSWHSTGGRCQKAASASIFVPELYKHKAGGSFYFTT